MLEKVFNEKVYTVDSSLLFILNLNKTEFIEEFANKVFSNKLMKIIPTLFGEEDYIFGEDLNKYVEEQINKDLNLQSTPKELIENVKSIKLELLKNKYEFIKRLNGVKQGIYSLDESIEYLNKKRHEIQGIQIPFLLTRIKWLYLTNAITFLLTIAIIIFK